MAVPRRPAPVDGVIAVGTRVLCRGDLCRVRPARQHWFRRGHRYAAVGSGAAVEGAGARVDAARLRLVARDHKHVARAAFISFIPWCALGIAIGLYFFTRLDSRLLTHGLGTLVIAYAAFAIWNALRPPERTVKLPRFTGALAGTLSGIVGAMFGTMGTLFFVVF